MVEVRFLIRKVLQKMGMEQIPLWERYEHLAEWVGECWMVASKARPVIEALRMTLKSALSRIERLPV